MLVQAKHLTHALFTFPFERALLNEMHHSPVTTVELNILPPNLAPLFDNLLFFLVS